MALWPEFLSFVQNLKNNDFFLKNGSDLVGEKKVLRSLEECVRKERSEQLLK